MAQCIYTGQFWNKNATFKKSMLEARLQKRLRRLHITSFSEYCSYILSKEGIKTELINVINVITTNKTDFFREPAYFEYLTEIILPTLIKRNGFIHREIKVWSAGCSSGEEPYTIYIVLNEYGRRNKKFRFSLLSTADIATIVLEKATLAIYPMEKIDIIPYELKKKYFLRSKDRHNNMVRLKP
jgi:chemotaxis protein methyltransferase CheR